MAIGLGESGSQDVFLAFLRVRAGMEHFLRHRLQEGNLKVNEKALSAVFEHLIFGEELPPEERDASLQMIEILRASDDMEDALKCALCAKSILLAASGEVDAVTRLGVHAVRSGLVYNGPTLTPEGFVRKAERFHAECCDLYLHGARRESLRASSDRIPMTLELVELPGLKIDGVSPAELDLILRQRLQSGDGEIIVSLSNEPGECQLQVVADSARDFDETAILEFVDLAPDAAALEAAARNRRKMVNQGGTSYRQGGCVLHSAVRKGSKDEYVGAFMSFLTGSDSWKDFFRVPVSGRRGRRAQEDAVPPGTVGKVLDELERGVTRAAGTAKMTQRSERYERDIAWLEQELDAICGGCFGIDSTDESQFTEIVHPGGVIHEPDEDVPYIFRGPIFVSKFEPTPEEELRRKLNCLRLRTTSPTQYKALCDFGRKLRRVEEGKPLRWFLDYM